MNNFMSVMRIVTGETRKAFLKSRVTKIIYYEKNKHLFYGYVCVVIY